MAQDISAQLRAIEASTVFVEDAADLVERWLESDAGPEAVEPVLRFIELHPDLDIGMPGPLVHFVERFFGLGYEQQLVASVGRRPTPATVWMLNRCFNGMPEGSARQAIENALRAAVDHPLATDEARDWANDFIDDIDNA